MARTSITRPKGVESPSPWTLTLCPAEHVNIAPAHEAVVLRPVAEQVFDAVGHAVDAVDPCENAGVLKHLDRLVNRIAAARGLCGDGLIGREAKPVPVAHEMPQEHMQNALVGGSDRTLVLALLFLLGVPRLDVSFDPDARVAVMGEPAR